MLKFAFYLLVFSLSLGQFSKLPVNFGFNLYLFDVLLFCFDLFALLYLFTKKSLKLPMYLLPFFCFAFVGFVSLIMNSSFFTQDQVFVSFFYLLRLFMYLLFGVVVFNLYKLKILSVSEILLSIVLGGVFLAFAGFIQLAILPDLSALDPGLGWDPHKNRLVSTFFDPNFTGGYLSICIAILMHYLYLEIYPINKKIILSLLAMLSLAAFLTFSRSTWGFLAVIIFVFGVFKSRKLLFFAMLLSFLTYFAVPRIQTRLSGITDPADSAYFRYISWQNTIKIIKDYPIFGVGFNTFRYVQKDYGFFDPGTFGGHSGAGSDSSMLLTLATTGIVGFLFYIFGYFYPLFGIRLKENKEVLLISVLFGMFVQSQFINLLFFPQIMFAWFSLLASLNN